MEKQNVFVKLRDNISGFFGKLGKKLGDFHEYKYKPIKYKVTDFLLKYLGFNWLGKQYRKLSNRAKKAICGYLFILPFIVGFIIFGAQPIFTSVPKDLAY